MTAPNFLLLVIDQERSWDSIFSLVPEARQTELWSKLPAHQWLRQNGVTFANHYASGIPCSPARSTIYTGFHAPDTQIINVMEFMTQSLGVYNPANPGSCDSAMPTLGDLLSMTRGSTGPAYYCAYKGKVHFALDSDLPDSAALESRYNFRDWTRQTTAYYDTAVEGFLHDEAIAQDSAQWLGTTAPKLVGRNGEEGTPWLLAVNLINPHDVQYAAMCPTLLPPGLGKSGLGIAPIPQSEPYYNWWTPRKPPNFGPATSSSDPRPFAVDGFAGILSVGFGNIPFSDDVLCKIWIAPGESIEVPMWQAYLNYYINCILDVDAKMWTVIQALLLSALSGVDLANTWIVFLSDHGEMAMSQAGLSAVYSGVTGQFPGKLNPVAPEMMPLRSKGSLQFEEAAHVPLIFAAAPATGSVLPDSSRNSTVAALSSHIDIVPTLLDLAVTPSAWYQNTFVPYLEQLVPPISGSLPGRSLAPILANPGKYSNTLAWGGRNSVLITGDALDTFDPLNAWAIATQDGDWWYLLPDLLLRAMMRAMVTVNSAGTGLIKFGRWFSAFNYSQQAQVTGSFSILNTLNLEIGYLGQDVQVFDLRVDPAELVNLATVLPDSEITALSESLQGLMINELSGPGVTPNETQIFLGVKPKCYDDASTPQSVLRMLKNRQAPPA